MKRNENLVPLSRDHHFGLLCSWKIREGLERILLTTGSKIYQLFWQESLSKHFEIEDTVLPEPENEKPSVSDAERTF